jgi:hypothetical protein
MNFVCEREHPGSHMHLCLALPHPDVSILCRTLLSQFPYPFHHRSICAWNFRRTGNTHAHTHAHTHALTHAYCSGITDPLPHDSLDHPPTQWRLSATNVSADQGATPGMPTADGSPVFGCGGHYRPSAKASTSSCTVLSGESQLPDNTHPRDVALFRP